MTQAAKIVLDTNAAIDALLFKDSRIEPVMRSSRAGTLIWVACPEMRAELADVLGRPALQKHKPKLADLMGTFDGSVTLQASPPPLPPALSALHCRDPDDQVFINLALQCGATWLVSRDRDLLSLARHAKRHGLAILVPERWAPSSPWSVTAVGNAPFSPTSQSNVCARRACPYLG